MKSLFKRTAATVLSMSVALGIPVTTAGAYSVSDEGEYYISFDSRYGFMADAEIGGTAASRKSVKFNFDSEDEVIDLADLTGELTNNYYTLQGWKFAFDDSGEIHTTVSKDDYTNGKYLYATAVFDTVNLPKNSGTYYVDLDLKSGTSNDIETYKYDGCNYAVVEFDASNFDSYNLPTPSKEGTDFNGWMLYNSDDGSYKKVTSLSADDFENNNSDVFKLTASYEKKAEGSDKTFFNLDANGGTISSKNTQAYTGVFHGNFAQSETIILDAYEPDSRKGYSFKGWNTEPDGSGEEVHTLSYTDIAWNSSGDDVKTYYAQWKKDEEDIYTIHFKSWYGTIDGKSENGMAQKDVEFTFTDDEMNLTDLSGEVKYKYYYFLGWKTFGSDTLLKTITKDDFPGDSKEISLTAQFNTKELPAGTDKYYIDMNFGVVKTGYYGEINEDGAYHLIKEFDKKDFEDYWLINLSSEVKERDDIDSFKMWYYWTGTEYDTANWCIDKDNFTKYSHGSDVIQVTAVYEKNASDDDNKNVLTLNPNGGYYTEYRDDGEGSKRVTITDPKRIKAITANSGETQILDCFSPQKDGYNFAGWNTKPDGSGTTYHDTGAGLFTVFSKENGVGDDNGNATLYAKWDEMKYNVKVWPVGGTLVNELPEAFEKHEDMGVAGKDVWYTISFTKSEVGDVAIELPDVKLDGAEFLGWYVKRYDRYYKKTTITKDDLMFNQEVTYIASFANKSNKDIGAYSQGSNLKFTLDANGGKIGGKDKATYRPIFMFESTEHSTQILDSFVPVKDGYEFKNWNTKADGSGETIRELVSYQYSERVSKEGELTLYAQYNKKQYTLMFSTHAYYFDKLETQEIAPSDIDSFEYKLPQPNQELPENVTFLGWFFISSKGEYNQQQVVRFTDKITGKEIKELAQNDSENFTDYLYLTAKFKVIGYEEDENGEPTPIYKNKDGNPVCRRQWWITLDANGGTIDGKDVEKYTIFSYWSDVTNPLNIPEFTPVRDGYVFKGWNTKQDGSGDYVTNGRIGPFYAQWEEDTAPKHDEIYGDLDNDKKVTSADSLLILRASVKLENFDDFKTKLADIDGDGKISSADALEVLRYSVKLPTKGNIGEKYKEN